MQDDFYKKKSMENLRTLHNYSFWHCIRGQFFLSQNVSFNLGNSN